MPGVPLGGAFLPQRGFILAKLDLQRYATAEHVPEKSPLCLPDTFCYRYGVTSTVKLCVHNDTRTAYVANMPKVLIMKSV